MAHEDDDDHVWDLYETPELIHRPPQDNQLLDVSLSNKSNEPSTDPPSKVDFDENSRILALVNTPALDWGESFGSGRGMRGRTVGGGRGFGHRNRFQWIRPPVGYICHRCNEAGHLIQHCPTNGDPNYDMKKMKPPTGIPKSMLIQNSEGFYALPSGDVAVLKPDEAAFEKQIEGMPSTRRLVGDVPKELYCQLCKGLMKFAVLCSKCCFQSFCDECIRNYIISKSTCVCGATDILADDLLPNMTLRKTINRIMESDDGSGVENSASHSQVQDMGSTNLQVNVPSGDASYGIELEAIGGFKEPATQESLIRAYREEVAEVDGIKLGAAGGFKEPASQASVNRAHREEVAEVGMTGNDSVTHESIDVKEPGAQGSAVLADEESEAAKKKRKKPESIGVKEPEAQGRAVLADEESEAGKKRKKPHMRPSDAAEIEWNAAQNLSAENYMMAMSFPAYNPYWTTGIQYGMEGIFTPCAGVIPYMGYGFGASGMPFGGMLQQQQLAGVPSMNSSRKEFEADKSVSKGKREADRTYSLEDQKFDSKGSSGNDIISTKSKSNSHQSKRSYQDCQERDYYSHEQSRKHGDDHYHYQDERHHRHHKQYQPRRQGDKHYHQNERNHHLHREHHHRSRHHHSVQTCH